MDLPQMVPVPARNKHMNQFSPAGLIGRDVTQGEISMSTAFTSPVSVNSVPAHAAGESSSDEMLIVRIAGGDRLAMQTLFARHRTAVYRWLLRMDGNEATAEDLLSDVFLDVWRQADRFQARSSVSTWLMAIARFKALSARRVRKDAELDETIEATVADPSDNPEIMLQKKNRDALVREALNSLTPDHKEIIDLVYYHEKSVDECARILGVPSGTVKTRMFYARKKMAEMVKAA
jgi:RNA polymerase sigma-70 factor, ECF subfamily